MLKRDPMSGDVVKVKNRYGEVKHFIVLTDFAGANLRYDVYNVESGMVEKGIYLQGDSRIRETFYLIQGAEACKVRESLNK